MHGAVAGLSSPPCRRTINGIESERVKAGLASLAPVCHCPLPDPHPTARVCGWLTPSLPGPSLARARWATRLLGTTLCTTSSAFAAPCALCRSIAQSAFDFRVASRVRRDFQSSVRLRDAHRGAPQSPNSRAVWRQSFEGSFCDSAPAGAAPSIVANQDVQTTSDEVPMPCVLRQPPPRTIA